MVLRKKSILLVIAISIVLIIGLFTPVMSFPVSINIDIIDITPPEIYEGDDVNITVCIKDPGNANSYITPQKQVSLSITYPDGSEMNTAISFTKTLDSDTACTDKYTLSSIQVIGMYIVEATYTEGGNSISTSETFVVIPRPCSVTINFDSSPIIYQGEDIGIQACLSGCSEVSNKDIRISVYDPKGFIHRATGTTDASSGCTDYISYLDGFDNKPYTKDAGNYIVVAESPFYGTMEITNFFVDVDCSLLPSDVSMGAFTTVSYRQRQDMTTNYYVACCDTSTPPYEECCRRVVFNQDCSISINEGVNVITASGKNLPEIGDLEESGYRILCQYMTNYDEYNVAYINSSIYEIIGRNTSANSIDFRLIDLEECIIANSSICDIRRERLVFNKDLYIDYVRENVVHHDRFCEGLYEAELIQYDGPYELDTPRYVDVFRQNFTDFFYCYHDPDHEPRVPLIVRNTKWCDRMNMRFYSVHQLGGLHVGRDYIDSANEWNTLAGTIVLGHACPWCMAAPRIFYLCGRLSDPIIKRPNDNKKFETVDFIDFLGSVSGQMNVDSNCDVVCEWDFGDGSKVYSCETQHRYRTNGTYRVELRVYYPFYTSEYLNTFINVEIVKPDITPSSASILEPIDKDRANAYYAVDEEITFAGHATGPGDLSDYEFRWDFGDNTGPDDGSEVTHSYSSGGEYTVILTVVNSSDNSQIGSDQITIKVFGMNRPNITNMRMWGCLGKEIERDTCLEFDIYNTFPSGLSNNPEPLTDIDVKVEVHEIGGGSIDHRCVPRERNCCNDKDEHTTHIARIDGQTSGKFYFNNLCHGIAEGGGKFDIIIEASRELNSYEWVYCMECDPDPDGFTRNGYSICSIIDFDYC